MAEMFKLPASSYEEVIKIIKAYSGSREGTLQTLDDIAQSTGMARTSVSANNGFLVQVGIVTEGNKKSTTEAGRMLGRAYTSKIDDEISRIWEEIVTQDEFLTRMITAVRVRNGMDKSSFINHIVYSSGQKDTKGNRAGAGTILEILKLTRIIGENEGMITVNELKAESEIFATSTKINDISSQQQKGQVAMYENHSSYVLNINLNISCEVNELDDISKKIKNLIEEISKD